MPGSVAMRRYLERHIESNLPHCPNGRQHWSNTVIIPAYREPAGLLQALAKLPQGGGTTLVILVLNRPDSDPDPLANEELRAAAVALRLDEINGGEPIYTLGEHTDLYLHDMDKCHGPIPAAQGVGLARKTGCDIALKWIEQGKISSRWICCTDADALLPPDYFQQLASMNAESAAVVFPFQHVPSGEAVLDDATALYELRLHHYVLGLEYAGSPYAHHSLGSCLAIRDIAYAQVRGFPKRSGGEDFYLLNKLAKLGTISKATGNCVQLQSRPSNRVPFGTGPAVAAILASGKTADATLFYHPHCFEALRAVLTILPELALTPAAQIPTLLGQQIQDQTLALTAWRTLESMSVETALDHCHRQGKTERQFLRQFHQWFDAFRTLKFLHALRDAGWQQQSLAQLETVVPSLWPNSGAKNSNDEMLRTSIRQHWGWQCWSR